MDKIYLVSLDDYGQHDVLGAFLSANKAGEFFLAEQERLRQISTTDGYERYHTCQITLEEYDIIES